MKLFASFLFALLIFSAINGQSSTANDCKGFPATAQIRGLYLHQPLVRAKKVIPTARFQPKPNGVIEASLKFAPSAPRPANLTDVQVLKASFIDNTLYSVIVVYRRTDIWIDVEDFVAEVSRKLGLPDPAMWKIYGPSQRQFLCGNELAIAGFTEGYPSLMFMDLGAATNVVKRQQAADYAKEELMDAIREERRAKFKP